MHSWNKQKIESLQWKKVARKNSANSLEKSHITVTKIDTKVKKHDQLEKQQSWRQTQ